MISSNVLIHFKESAKNHLDKLGWKYEQLDGELNVYVDEIPYDIRDGYYQDPDELLCEHYGFNYDLINCIELA